MMRKKRGYKREIIPELVRDYKLFAIACEGGKREPEYFNVFRFLSPRIAVDVIEEIVSDAEALSINPNRSAPKWVLERALKYIEKEGLNDEDDLWFVMDVDQWNVQQLREIATYCEQFPNWHIALSNPCFEIWLYFHKKSDTSLSKSTSCRDLKNEISILEKGGYHPLKFITSLPEAIMNAKAVDTEKNYFMPKFKESKVYELVEAFLKVVGKNGFNNFINNTLPMLLQQEILKTKKSKRKRP